MLVNGLGGFTQSQLRTYSYYVCVHVIWKLLTYLKFYYYLYPQTSNVLSSGPLRLPHNYIDDIPCTNVHICESCAHIL